MSDPKHAIDYPSLEDRLFVIWSSNGIKWPDARRELHYLSATRTDIMKGYALFTSEADGAKTFDTEADAQKWLAENNDKRPHPYVVTVSTVATMKVACGFTVATADYMRADSPVSGHSAEWHFFRSYVGTALWSSVTDDESEGPVITDEHDISDLAPATLDSMLADCARFYDANKEHIHCDGAPLSREFEGSIVAREAAMAGHDFWLTRCGHGAGFWDGDWPEPAASALDTASKEFGNVDLYVGDDGQIYA